ncbi:MAG TPA: alanine racemase [Acidobacteriota bacterium]|nr:alanine racemase [Acidobacteriota bacterium]
MRSWVEISASRLRHNLSVLRRYLAYTGANRWPSERAPSRNDQARDLEAESSHPDASSPDRPRRPLHHHAPREVGAEDSAGRPLWYDAGSPAIIAVVKADAYGHGLDLVAPVLYREGIRHFAVAHLDEAESLRRVLAKMDGGSGSHKEQASSAKQGSKPARSAADQTWASPGEAEKQPLILVLGGIQEGREDDFRRLGATASVFDSRPHPRGVPAHLKIDTGMGRLGILPQDVQAQAARLGSDLTGLFSHLHSAEADPEETRRQIDLFLRSTDFLKERQESSTNLSGQPIGTTEETPVSPKSPRAENTEVRASGASHGRGENVEREGGESGSKSSDGQAIEAKAPHRRVMRHLSSSTGLPYPASHLDAVRIGLALYGIDPGDAIEGLLPVLGWKSRILTIKDVPAGSTIGYGATHRCQRDTRLGVVPVGYADGYSRLLSNRAQVELHPGGKTPTPNDPRSKRAGATLGQDAERGRARYDRLLAPVIGIVSMDLITIDLSAHPDIAPGSEVTLLSPDPDSPCSAQSLAALQNTLPYEVLTSIGPRTQRTGV